MEITGKFIETLAPKGGQSARGSWKRQDFILETEEQFPKKVCISNWNDKVDIASLKPGARITAHINIESREYNGNWYTDVKVWKMDVHSGSSTQSGSDDLPGLGAGDIPWQEPPAADDSLPF